MSAPLRDLKFAWDYFVRGKHRSSQRAETARWIEPPLLELQLRYSDFTVAELHRAFPHQGTWSGEYDLRIAVGDGSLQDSILAYIAFCEDFNRRIAEGQDHDFDELEAYSGISDPGSWEVRLPTGVPVPMSGRMWFADGEAYWQHPETEPSTEAAANECWNRMAQLQRLAEPQDRSK